MRTNDLRFYHLVYYVLYINCLYIIWLKVPGPLIILLICSSRACSRETGSCSTETWCIKVVLFSALMLTLHTTEHLWDDLKHRARLNITT